MTKQHVLRGDQYQVGREESMYGVISLARKLLYTFPSSPFWSSDHWSLFLPFCFLNTLGRRASLGPCISAACFNDNMGMRAHWGTALAGYTGLGLPAEAGDGDVRHQPTAMQLFKPHTTSSPGNCQKAQPKLPDYSEEQPHPAAEHSGTRVGGCRASWRPPANTHVRQHIFNFP